MRLFHHFFRIITNWLSLASGNLVILAMVLFVLYASGRALSSCLVADLRSETISTIIIAWGVLLESRKAIRHKSVSSIHGTDDREERINSESESWGLLFVCLGLLLEIITYFDASAHMAQAPAWLSSILHGIIWCVLVGVCTGLCVSCLQVVQIRFAGVKDAEKKL